MGVARLSLKRVEPGYAFRAFVVPIKPIRFKRSFTTMRVETRATTIEILFHDTVDELFVTVRSRLSRLRGDSRVAKYLVLASIRCQFNRTIDFTLV